MATIYSRSAGLTGALAVQAGFIALFVYASIPFSHHVLITRELFLMLSTRRIEPERNKVIDARSTEATPKSPIQLNSQALSPLKIIPESGIAAIGRSLFNCAPENYSNLSRDDRAKCPNSAEMHAPDNDGLVIPRSHAKDEAIWQEYLNEKQWDAGECPAGALLISCQIQRYTQEQKRGRDARRNLNWQRQQREKKDAEAPDLAPVP